MLETASAGSGATPARDLFAAGEWAARKRERRSRGECLNGEIILQPEGGPDNQSEAGRNHYNTTTYRPPAPLTIAPTLNEYREVPLMRYNLERP